MRKKFHIEEVDNGYILQTENIPMGDERRVYPDDQYDLLISYIARICGDLEFDEKYHLTKEKL